MTWAWPGVVAVVATGAGACHAQGPTLLAATPTVGVSIALYQHDEEAIAVADDRRWVELAGGELVVEGIDATVPLASLAIEPLGPDALAIGACRRARIDLGSRASSSSSSSSVMLAPIRCVATGAPGRHLIRLVYVVPLAYRALHEVTMIAPGRATVTTRYAIATPSDVGARDVPGRSGPVAVQLYDGVPGSARRPVRVATGTIALDGTVATIATTAREVPARLVHVFGGPAHVLDLDADEHDDEDDGEGTGRRHVWVWLELDGLQLSPGAVHAHLAVPGEVERHVEVSAARWSQLDDTVRAPLWVDETLRGTRRQTLAPRQGARLADRFAFSVSNVGAVAREVWIEEPFRDDRRGVVRAGWPTRPVVVGRSVRAVITIEPRAIGRVAFVITYP